MGCTTTIPKEPSYKTTQNEQDTILNGTTKNNKQINNKIKLNQNIIYKYTFNVNNTAGNYAKIPFLPTNVDGPGISLLPTQKQESKPKETKYIQYIINNQDLNADTECISYDECTQLLRLINASKYYHSLSSNHPIDKHKFTQFCVDEYKLCLDDYIHLITEHSDDLTQIENNFELECNVVNKCEYTKRHYDNNINNNTDYEYDFYIQLFDTIHVYVFHLNQLALRIKSKSFLNGDKSKEFDENYFNCIIDQEIVNIRNEINKNEQYTINFNRLNKHKNKRFIIETNAYNKCNNDNNSITFTDQMINYIRHNSDELKEDILTDLSMYITSEQYDTDSIISDFDICYNNNDINITQNKCNILLYALNNNTSHAKYIKQFMKNRHIASNKFMTGFHFFYHTFYNNIQNQQNIEHNRRNCTEMIVENLFVSAHYNSMKEEVLNSGFVNMKQFQQILFKGNKFMETNKCKNMKCIHGKDGIDVDPLHFNIGYGTLLKKSHIYCLILYCDYSDFLNLFLSTFKRIIANESIESVKKRHNKYYHFAKYLTEVIQYYGITGNWECDMYDCGPFYAGVSSCVYIDSFAIGFNTPVSTSKHNEIIMRFTDMNGIMIQLNNQQLPAQNEPFFDTSFISCFPEENEHVFWTFRYNIEIETIIKLQTNSNYQIIMDAYSKIDLILSGKSVDNKLITKRDIFIVNKLIEYVLDNMSVDNYKLDDYILNNFYLYTMNKTEINLHLDSLYDIKENEIVNLIMHSVRRIDYLEIEDNKYNLFKPIIFKLLPNLKEIVIHSSTSCYNVYAFNMLSLLSVLMDSQLPICFRRIVIKDEYPLCSIQWLKNTFSEQIKSSFAAKKLNIEFLTKQGSKLNEDWIIINT